jgi:prepilin-type N-terminal cleavage/methylation domain-containing protein/prepilin-type processing-associated H-X9-DG protein
MQGKYISNSKSAFTLLELLVVIAIIGILATVMLGFFSGTTETTRATECMNNLRALAQAANSYAMQDLEQPHTGAYPAAGSFLYYTYGMGGVGIAKRHGWIARQLGEKQVGAQIVFSDEDNFKNKNAQDGLRYALTQGRLWSHVNGSRKLYQCPVHAAACYKKNKRHPGWSYVMNAQFGWAHDGKDPLRAWNGKCHGFTSAPDRVLLFAEIQGVDAPEYNLQANLNEKGDKGDSVLQYDDKEVIGFNHKQKIGHWAGHVAFVDGHVQKLLVPEKGSINLEKLTQKLCNGHELSYRSGVYTDLQER